MYEHGKYATAPDVDGCAAYLEQVCPIPNAHLTLEGYERAHHLDLPALTDAVLAREQRRARRRADEDPDPNHAAWCEERCRAIATEWHRRRARPAVHMLPMQGRKVVDL